MRKRVRSTAIHRLAMAALLCAAAATARAAETDWATLAGYWAPVIAQGTSYGFTVDVITAVDFDGDWNVADNDAADHDLPSVVYYWGMETAGYYYLGYALYHLGGMVQGDDGDTRFRNDMHGVVLAIRKTETQPMGQFVALRTWGTTEPSFYVEKSSTGLADEATAWLTDNVAGATPGDDAVGDIDFVIDTLGFHPVIYSRAADHAVFGEKEQAQFPEGPPVFESGQLVDWRHVPTIVEADTKQLGKRTHRPGDSGISGGESGVPPDDGLLYRYEGESMTVITARSRGRGTVLHHWNLIAYDLAHVDDLWQRRLDFETGQGETFAGYGVFDGAGEPEPSSRAPWAWGAVFFDPAAVFAAVVDGASGEDAGTILAASFEKPQALAEEYASRVRP